MGNEEKFWKKLVIYGALGFSRVWGLVFKCQSGLKVCGKVCCRGFLLWGGLSWTRPSSMKTFCKEKRGVSWGWSFPFVFNNQDSRISVLG